MMDPTQQIVRDKLGRDGATDSQTTWRPAVDEVGETPKHASTEAIDEEMTSEFPAETADDTAERPRPKFGLARGLKPGSRLRGTVNATTGTWIGVVLVAVGFGALFYTWSKVAGVLNVAEQLPYVVSGGIVGLALVIVGVTVVDVAVRRQDSYERRQQLAQMSRTLAELRELYDAADELPYDGEPGEREWEG